MSDDSWPAGKTFGELTPAQKHAAATRAAKQLQSELRKNAGAIGAAMDAAETPPTRTHGRSATVTRDEIIASVLCKDPAVSRATAEWVADDALGRVITDDASAAQPGHSGHSVRPDKTTHTAWDDMPKTGGFSAGRD
jgi:hypothetical protein